MTHESRFWQFKDVAIWPRPYQQPHPPPSTSFDYVRPENRPFAEMDREKIRQITLADVEKRVHGGQLFWGTAKDVTDSLIARAEYTGANAVLLNTCNGVVPHELYMEQIRRLGRDVLPRLHAHQATRVPHA